VVVFVQLQSLCGLPPRMLRTGAGQAVLPPPRAHASPQALSQPATAVVVVVVVVEVLEVL
jgi:hypothetical protein